jgi:hypothetical protein
MAPSEECRRCMWKHTFASGSSENTITFFSSDGTAQSTCVLDSKGYHSHGGYNGRLFSMGREKDVIVYDRSGKELWVVDRSTRKVERYELP